MREHTRNVAVGLTVMVALAMLAGMTFIFAGLPEMFQRGYYVRIQSDSTHNISRGDDVLMSGMRVGSIVDVRFTDPQDPTGGVTMTARINPDIKVPANVKAVVFTRGFVGSPYLALVPEGPLPEDQRHLPTDRVATISAERRGDGLLPDELKPALEGLAKLTDNLNELIAPDQPAPVAPDNETDAPPGVEEAPPGLRGTIDRLNRTLDAVYKVVGDVENQRNIHDSLANIRDAADAATKAMKAVETLATDARRTVAAAEETMEDMGESSRLARERMDDVAAGLLDSTEQISTLMSTINQTAMKIESGEGTAGRLVNDPELYNNLLDATREMSRLTMELRTLVETWKETGVPLRVR